jgi:pimeloyl-ACP methyl ester carboxylesterase
VSAESVERSIAAGGIVLSAQDGGAGPPVVLLHGLTATRRYVVMGSRALERGGHRVIAYDARGHGRSDPALNPHDYGHERLAADLEAVLDALELDRALLAGASMGAHTILRFALDHPARVAALGVITPAYDPATFADAASLARWDALAEGLREGGVEGFVAAYGDPGVPDAWRETTLTVLRQRLAAHEHPGAVADALQAVPRSRPFAGMEELAGITAPTVVVASRDDVDPGHPFAVAQEYARRIPGAALLVEEPGRAPLAWQGGRLSRVLGELADRVTADKRT